MDVQATLFGFFGGLAIFLYGMNLMSEGLKKMGSDSFKRILNSLTKNRFTGITVGLFITCVIQSSSATSVMVVGLINASLLSLQQGIAVVLGADIGTTITAWIVSAVGKFSITQYSLPLIFVGFLVNFVAKKRKTKMIGQALLGFGLLFLGLGTMSGGVKSIKESELIRTLFNDYGSNPFLGLLVGTIVTMIIQSSSASIAIIQLMAFQGLFGLEAALPLMMGADIGTTITAQLAAIGGTKGARGVAMANTFFKLFGALLFLPFLITGAYEDVVLAVIPDAFSAEANNTSVMAQIAFAHTGYITINVVIFSLVLWRPLLRAAKWAARIKDTATATDTIYLDPLLLLTPPIAVAQCVKQLAYMTAQCEKNIRAAFEAFIDKNLEQAKKIEEREDRIDDLQTEITEYLIKLSSRELDERESKAIPALIHAINDAERVGDHAENLLELAELEINEKRSMSLEAKRELHNYFNLVDRQFTALLAAMEHHDEARIQEVLDLEEHINFDQEALVHRHIERLEAGTCTVQAGVLFVDMIANLEKIGDHLTNIAERLEFTNGD